MSTVAKMRLLSDLKRFNNKENNLYCMPKSDNLFIWETVIFGPDETIWEERCFKLILEFTEDYPTKPPNAKFITKIFHPNVYSDWRIFLDILNNQWSSNYDVQIILESLQSLQSLLDAPNPTRPANAEAAKLFVENKKEFKKEFFNVLKILGKKKIK